MESNPAILSELFHGIDYWFGSNQDVQKTSNEKPLDLLYLAPDLDDGLGAEKSDPWGEDHAKIPVVLSDGLRYIGELDSTYSTKHGISSLDKIFDLSRSESDDPEAPDIALDRVIPDDCSFSVKTTSYPFNQSVYTNVASTIFHILFIFAVSFTAYASVTGQHGLRQEPIFVSLVDPQSSTVCAATRGSLDSASSAPSIANRSRSNEEGKMQDGKADCESNVMTKDHGEAPLAETVENAMEQHLTKLVEKGSETPRKTARDDSTDYESKSNQDSIASLPSTAMVEKRSASTYGDQMNEFRLKLLAAIHNAAYFPRKALRSKKFGEVMVAFTLVDGGQIEDLRVDKTSGSEILDEAALEILMKASGHFPGIPASSAHKKISYVVPITFRK